MQYRKIIIIGAAPGALAGDITRPFQATLTQENAVGGTDEILDTSGSPVKYRRFGARPAGAFGRGDAGDPGIPTLRFRVAFWLRAAPGQWKPLPRLDRAGNESASWLIPSRVSTDGAQGLQKFEADALRSGEIVERVIDEAGGQIEETMPKEQYDAILVGMWEALQAEFVSPAISGARQIGRPELLRSL